MNFKHLHYSNIIKYTEIKLKWHEIYEEFCGQLKIINTYFGSQAKFV